MPRVTSKEKRKNKLRDKTFFIIVCRKCGWKWVPNPKKWRNNLNKTKRVKVLPCPQCSVKNRIRYIDVKRILKHNLAES
jgi:hypothetical protein